MTTSDTNPDYWAEYSNLQHIKHNIIRNYLNGWFPKMAMGEHGVNRLLYIDTHAGRGKYLRGQLGSPLVALTTLCEHSARDKILNGTEVRYIFIERDEENLESLRQELSQSETPSNVNIETTDGDCFEIINNAINDLESQNKQLAPAFVFLDPYGFKLPGQLLHRLMEFPKTELFVNVIWRELDMAIAQGLDGTKPGMVSTLNSIFNGDSWKTTNADESDGRAEQCAKIFQNISGAKWGTYIRMLSNNRIRYFLLHLTNHPSGRDLMKECIWKACPDGGYYASKSDNPDQMLLIEPEPNLQPLCRWIESQLENGPKRWNELTENLRSELWIGKQLNKCISEMKKDKIISPIPNSYSGKFSMKNNPLLQLPKNLFS